MFDIRFSLSLSLSLYVFVFNFCYVDDIYPPNTVIYYYLFKKPTKEKIHHLFRLSYHSLTHSTNPMQIVYKKNIKKKESGVGLIPNVGRKFTMA